MEFCAGVDWANVKGAGAGAGQHEGDAKAEDEPRDYLAASNDESEETLHLSASSGGPSLTVKKKVVKTKNTNDKKKKKKLKKIMQHDPYFPRTPTKLEGAGAGAGMLGNPWTRRGARRA